jgi:hypothetical protein
MASFLADELNYVREFSKHRKTGEDLPDYFRNSVESQDCDGGSPGFKEALPMCVGDHFLG